MLHLLFHYFRILVNKRIIILSAAIYIFMGWSSAQRVLVLGSITGLPVNSWDGIIEVFSGPNNTELNLLDFLTWLIIHVYPLFIINRILQSSLGVMDYVILPRIGSRRAWYLSHLLLLALFCFMYMTAAIFFTGIGISLALPWDGASSGLLNDLLFPYLDSFPAVELIAWIWVLTGGTIFTLAVLQLFLSFFLEKTFYSFLAIIIICLTAWLSVDNVLFQMLLPGTQSMLLRHYPFNPNNQTFTLLWSLSHDIILCALLIVVGIKIVSKLDFLNIP